MHIRVSLISLKIGSRVGLKNWHIPKEVLLVFTPLRLHHLHLPHLHHFRPPHMHVRPRSSCLLRCSRTGQWRCPREHSDRGIACHWCSHAVHSHKNEADVCMLEWILLYVRVRCIDLCVCEQDVFGFTKSVYTQDGGIKTYNKL